MQNITENTFSLKNDFYCGNNPYDLINQYGSPLYVYNEIILRQCCNDIKNLINFKNFKVNYSPKANSNVELLKIIRDEGLNIDAMSPGEIEAELRAGYSNEEILYIGNNVSKDELLYVIERNIRISVDSISQLELLGKIKPGSEVVVRFNPGSGAGHHEKVVTAGKKTKFGIEDKYISEVKNIQKKYNLKIIGINQHIGSLFLNKEPYILGVKSLLSIAENFENLSFIDFGGGFGVPYKETDKRLDLLDLGNELTEIVTNWAQKHNPDINFKVEPGRYIVAECGILLGKVYSKKMNYGQIYIGTDLGFNILYRPVLYNAHHPIEVYRNSNIKSTKKETVKIVGNICESGDIIADDRHLEEILEEDLIGILNAGAYGYSMCSNYNNRLKPAEILIEKDGNVRVIRRKEELRDLFTLY